MRNKCEKEKYIYRNCPIPGGGYVTGFIFHPNEKGLLYCRTDIGGTYRYVPETDSWRSLIDHVTVEDLSETFPIAIALDPSDPDRLYIACGINGNPHGKLAVSDDRGEHFKYYELPVMVHGNLNGRGTGFHLTVDPADSRILYFASQQQGLWKSSDCGGNWAKITAFPEEYMTMIAISPDGKFIMAAGAGVSTQRSDHLRGHSVYVSFDMGQSFIPLPGPEDMETEGIDLAGHVAHRYAFDDRYMYITFSVMGRNAYVRENGYSCDGGSVIGGRIFRYELADIKPGNLCADVVNGLKDYGKYDFIKDITPAEYPVDTSVVQGLLEYGFSGISTGEQKGILIASTISREEGDCIFRSFDHGDTWTCILNGLETGTMKFRTSYMKPEYNGGRNLIHWMTDLKIDPFDENKAWFNTGTGVFRTDNLSDGSVCFSDRSDGIEETVHLNLYSPVAGEVKLIDILGDLGGFAFKDLDCPCANSFADEKGNRYITCINADFSDIHPETVVVTPRGNWTGLTKGGLIVSTDQCATFNRVALPYGLSDELDRAFEKIETPNVNSGWAAISADAVTIVWTVADGCRLPADRVIVSHDLGRTFAKVRITDLEGRQVSDDKNHAMKVFADRVRADVFYGFGENSKIYISTDSGDSFRQLKTPENFPKVDFGMIDCADKTEVRGEGGQCGCFYMALAEAGMWKLEIDAKENADISAHRLSAEGDIIYRLGLGVGRPDGNYLTQPKAVYLSGSIGGEYGFYRTCDDGKTYTKLNDETQMFGDINSIEGDSRTYGRFFLATGSRGVLYGEPDGD